MVGERRDASTQIRCAASIGDRFAIQQDRPLSAGADGINNRDQESQ